MRNKIIKIFNIVLLLSLILVSNTLAKEFKKGFCSIELQLTQNLNAPWPGQKYVRNGKYNHYTRGIVKEAHILQKHLNRLGFNAGKVDGIIGPKTRAAILRLQRFLGTKADGYVGPKTRALLNNSCGDMVDWGRYEAREFSGKIKLAKNEKELRNFMEVAKNYRLKSLAEDIAVGPENEIKLAGLSNSKLAIMEDSVKSLKAVSMDEGDYSKTNIQVQGVDEADIVKTDGRYIFTLSGNKIFIIDTQDKKAEYQMKNIAKIEFSKNENIKEFYLYKNKLIVISHLWGDKKNLYAKKIAYPYYQNKRFSRITIYNIDNLEKPKKEKVFDLEGLYKESRVNNGYLYFITNKNIFDNILPVVKIDGVDRSVMFGSSFYYLDSPDRNFNLSSIYAINLDKLEDISVKRILIPYSGSIYMSKDSLYLTYNKFIDWNRIYDSLRKEIVDLIIERERRLEDNNIDVIDDKNIKPIYENDTIDTAEIILNSDFSVNILNEETVEKTQKEKEEELRELKKKKEKIDKKFKEDVEEVILDFYKENKDSFEKTVIQKFNLSGTKISVDSSAEVGGRLLNQFSMYEDEDKNFFVATTKSQRWIPWDIRKFIINNPKLRQETENNLYSLNKNLEILDSLVGLAKGERIKAVRFIKNRAYLVTFKQIDPLFDIDISNPKRLKLLGELKIDGFLSYLHPVFEDRLIGLGREVYTDKYGNQRNGAIKVTLFDISNDKPREIKTVLVGGPNSYSEGFNNHKAVLISEDKKIMAFPAVIYKKNNEYNWGDREYAVMVLKISKNNLSLTEGMEFNKNWNEQAKRVLRIGEKLYGISNNLIKSFDLKEYEENGKLYLSEEIEKEEGLIPIIIY